MQKIIHPCDVPMWDGKKYPLFCEITFEDGRLSIVGVVGPRKNGNAKGSCGQVDSEFWHPTIRPNMELLKPSQLRFSDGWNREHWLKFLRYWHQWHLNDMRAECEHQRKSGITYKEFPWHVCSECGYKIGSAWLTEDVPPYVIAFLESLPDTDKTPAWV